MNVHAASTLDIEKLRKVHGLMTGGATEGERAAARTRAEAMAKKAGMTLDVALSKLDDRPKAQAANFFEGFDDWCEEREPGWKAKRAKEKAERDARDSARRAEVLSAYPSETAIFKRSAEEAALLRAVTPIADEWEDWTDDDGEVHRYPVRMDGRKSRWGTWYIEDITPNLSEVVKGAYPWPMTLRGILDELKAWDQLKWDRALFCGGEYNHYPEVECRYALLEDALKQTQPAASWDDVQARFDWKRYDFVRQFIDPTERDEPFLDRLEADFALLREQASKVDIALAAPRSNAEKRAAVLSMLDDHPELSDREIARRIGVSPQTVSTWRKKR